MTTRRVGTGRCPKCGEEGTFIIKKVGDRAYLYVRHGRRWCYIGPISETETTPKTVQGHKLSAKVLLVTILLVVIVTFVTLYILTSKPTSQESVTIVSLSQYLQEELKRLNVIVIPATYVKSQEVARRIVQTLKLEGVVLLVERGDEYTQDVELKIIDIVLSTLNSNDLSDILLQVGSTFEYARKCEIALVAFTIWNSSLRIACKCVKKGQAFNRSYLLNEAIELIVELRKVLAIPAKSISTVIRSSSSSLYAPQVHTPRAKLTTRLYQ